MPGFKSYQSPYSWRYGSDEMRRIWSEVHKRRLWRQMWLALAAVQAHYGLVSEQQLAELGDHVAQVDMERALEIEAEIHHDLMAELKTYAGQCPLAGGVLHLGATSMDIEDNTDALRMRQSLDLIIRSVESLLSLFAQKIERYADLPIIAFTHLQPAEPSTLGYRLAQYGQDLLFDWENLSRTRSRLRGKGFRGAVGTGASYGELIGVENLAAFETQLSTRLGLPFYPVTTQTYPREQEYHLVSALAGLGSTLYKFGFDLRLLQSPPVGEWQEPFAARQVGSSAMPFKRNPIQAEKLDSLARLLAQMPRVAWDNAAHSLLERTLDDSANRRTLLPEAFLVSDELLRVSLHIVDGLAIDEMALARNLAVYGPFAATERLLMALGKAGADRQEMHERLRIHSLAAWKAVQAGEGNPLLEALAADPEIQAYLPAQEIMSLMQVTSYVGDAPRRARLLADTIRRSLQQPAETAG